MVRTFTTWLGTYSFGRSDDPEMIQGHAEVAERVALMHAQQGHGGDDALESERVPNVPAQQKALCNDFVIKVGTFSFTGSLTLVQTIGLGVLVWGTFLIYMCLP